MKKGRIKGYDNGVQGTKGYKLEILQCGTAHKIGLQNSTACSIDTMAK